MKTQQDKKNDVLTHEDVEDIVARFYHAMLEDSIVGFIFTDVAKIDLAEHLPIIVNFWTDILFKQKNYAGNALQKHLELNQLINLKPGHFTRWLYLFNQAVDQNHAGTNAQSMKDRAEMVANSISAKISQRSRGDIKLVLPKKS